MRSSHKLYYTLKPYLPWWLRMKARRWHAGRIRRANTASWPIDEAAGKPPPHWPGWPQEKQFAFVITHDVEGPAGLAKVRKLAEFEMELGFRSSFNFVPEGSYTVPAELRDWLVKNGFEVGVHDLNHDGKLYRSRECFRSKAARINHYLKAWNAVGYRSGFMIRQKAWHADLNIAYDATSFDTDPFEPLPEAAGTIFPAWVDTSPQDGSPVSASATPRGYVELPYTLPQDSTLFLVLREKTPEIWFRKLDWVAAKGGLALVNVHPDYLRFENEKNSGSTFDINHYRELLNRVKQVYQEKVLLGRPKDIAALISHHAPSHRSTPMAGPEHRRSTPPPELPLRGKRTLVLLYSYYPSDPRPRRAAEAMVEAGSEVELVCLREDPNEKRDDEVNGVEIRRLPLGKTRGGKLAYFLQYAAFLTYCFLIVAWRSLGKRYDIVHVHNMPDILVFAALPARLRGARIILDLHDPMPELMTSIYGLSKQHWLVSILRVFERWSIGFANLVLTPNVTFKTLFTSRSCRAEKLHIVMNAPQQEIFDPDRFGPDAALSAETDEFRVMHHGSIVHRHGIDLLVEAVASLVTVIPGIRLDIYGPATPFLDTVLKLAADLGVKDRIHYHGAKSQEEIAAAIRTCHLGVVPNRRSLFTETNFPTRLFEYLSMHRPVLAPTTQGIRDYFTPDEMIYFDPDKKEDLARQILWVRQNPDQVQERVARGITVYRRHLWSNEKSRLIALTDQLATR